MIAVTPLFRISEGSGMRLRKNNAACRISAYVLVKEGVYGYVQRIFYDIAIICSPLSNVFASYLLAGRRNQSDDSTWPVFLVF